MNEWPAEWFRDGKPQPDGAPDGPGAAYPGASDPTVALPSGGASPAAPGAGRTGPVGPSTGGPGGNWPSQPPRYSGQGGYPGQGTAGPDYPGPGSHGSARPGRAPGRPPRGPRRRVTPRRVIKWIALAVVVILVISIGLYFYLDSTLHRESVLVNYAQRPAAGAGQNWLITGSDSRQGLTKAQERQLATGHDISGHRSDTIMLLHIPGNGNPPVLVSLPRDSYVPIPGYGSNKINAAYSFGGPKLLVKTVENVTGLRIDHYMGIGFGGLVNVVNAVGGVRMCLSAPLKDPASGLNLKAGCQTLDGAQALGYVRTRHTFASQDLQRVQNQRAFLSALLTKVTSPGTLVNPFTALPAGFGAAGALSVDSGTHLYQLIEVAFALRHPETTTVPIANANYLTPAGDALQWDRQQALELFNDLNADRKVPKSLLTGSKVAG